MLSLNDMTPYDFYFNGPISEIFQNVKCHMLYSQNAIPLSWNHSNGGGGGLSFIWLS